MSRFSWIRKLVNPWRGNASDVKRRPFTKLTRPSVEQLEVRELLAGTLGLSGGVLTLADTGSPIITVAIASNNYTITDSAGISGTIPGWTISGNTATETDAGAASITGLMFNTTNGTFGTATTGIAVRATTAVTIVDAGNATIGGAFTGATTGSLNIQAAGSIADNASITLTTGTITIAADTAGTGSAGFTQAAAAALATTNTSASAISITANTSSGGTGNINIVSTTTGTGGTLTINSNGGSILNTSSDTLSAGDLGTSNGGSAPTHVLGATNFNLTATGSGSIGTPTAPIETTNTGTDAMGGSNFSLNAGDGGAYLTDWGGVDLTLTGASATGPGGIRVVTGNAGGHNLYVTGNVSAVNGNIYLAADDNLEVHNANVTIGGAAFTGTVWMSANRDVATNGQPVKFTDATESILTSNTTNQNIALSGRTPTTQAVYLEIGGGTSGPGIVQVANITTGDGGRVVLNGGNLASPTQSGTINMVDTSDVINVGATGTLELDAIAQATTPADYIGSAAKPIVVAGGNVVVNSQFGNAWVTGTAATSFTANVTKLSTQTTTAPSLNFTTTAGDLTVGAIANINNGTVNLSTASGNITVSAPLGSANTGPIALNAGSSNVNFTTAQTFTSNDPIIVTAGNAADFQTGSSLTLNGGNFTGSALGTQVDQGSTLAWGSAGTPTVTGNLAVAGAIAPTGTTTGTLTATGNFALNATGVFTVNASTAVAGQFSAISVSGAATLDPSSTLAVNVIGTSLNVNDQLTVLTAAGGITGTFANGTVTVGAYTFAVAVNTTTVVLTVTSAPQNSVLDVPSAGVVAFAAAGANVDTLLLSVVNGNYVISDPVEPIVLTPAAFLAGWTNTDGNGNANPNDASLPNSNVITSYSFSLSGGADIISGIAAGSANVTISGATSLSVTGAITTTGNVTFSTFPAVDFEANVTATGNIAFSGVSAITDGTTGTPGTLTGATLTPTASSGIGSVSLPILTAGTTVNVSSGAADAYVTQTTGSVSFTGTATGGANLFLADTDSAGTLTIGGATSTVGGSINLSSAGTGLVIAAALNSNGGSITMTETGSGDITNNAAITSTNGPITLTSSNNIFDNANINAAAGTISINANSVGAGTAGFTQGSAATITSTSAANAVTISVGGNGDANIRTIAATSGTLTVNTSEGSILYAGTDTLDVQQSATFTLFPGITGPAPSGTGAGGTGAAPTGTVNALNYSFSTDPNGPGSIGTAARPINTSTPANNTESLAAGSGGIYFVDFGNPMTLNGATATGAGNVEVVAENANGHNLTVAGNVSTGSGTIVLAADDNFIVNSNVTIGGEDFSGSVYIAGNRDTGNTTTVTVNGTITTSNTTASAVVIEGFHMVGNGTAAGVVTVNNITTGDGGTITISTVPYNLTATGQGSIAALNSSSVLNAGPTGTVNFIATMMAGNSLTSAVGTAATPMMVTAGNVIVTANSGTGALADSVYVTDTIAGNFTATTGTTSPSGTINFATTSGILTVAGTITTGSNSAINLTGAGGVTVSAPLGSTTTGAIAINGGSGGVLFASPETFYSNDPVAVTASTPAEIASTSTITLSGGTLASPSGVLVDNGGTLTGAGTVNTGTNETMVDGTLAPTVSATGLNTDLTLNSDANLTVMLNSAAAGNFSVVNVAGPVTLNNPTLVIDLGGPINVGDSFKIISNDLADPVTGTFGNSTFTSNNLPGYTFSVNYAGGDGNDVVLTVTSVPAFDSFDVTGTTGTFVSAPSVNNALTLTNAAGVYTLTDASEAIVLTSNAIAAGWSHPIVDGSPVANEVTGPTSYSSGGNTVSITDLNFLTADGSDAIAGLAAGAANVSVLGFGNLALNGPVTTTGNAAFSTYATVDVEANVTATGNITFSGVSTISDGAATASTPGTLTGATLTLSATNGIGSASLPVLTAGTTVTVSPGTGSAFVTQTTGSVSFAGAATGAGSLTLVDTDSTGTLTIGGATSTVTGNIAISAAGAIADNANINAGSGTIAISADTAGTGAAGFTQGTAVTIATTNTTANALSISVNTAGGGTGSAVLGAISVGSASGGTITVNTNEGSILNSTTAALTSPQQGLSNGGSAPAQVIAAANYRFTAAGAGSVGTPTVPIEATNFGADGVVGASTFNVNAGDGGAYLVKWGGVDMTLTGASATGAGNIRIVAANAGGDNLYVAGNVSAVDGNIYLAADDNFEVHNANVTIGGAGFTGTVWMQANRDLATNGQPVEFTDPTEAIVTSNTTNQNVALNARTPTTQAVYLDIGGGTSGPGIVEVANITVGDGGRVVLNGSSQQSPTQSGAIIMTSPTDVINVGLTGTLELDAISQTTTAADHIGTAATPIQVAGGNVVVNSQAGNVWVTGTAATSFSANMTALATQTAGASINFATTAGPLTIGSALANINSGTTNLSSPAGIVLNAAVGSGTTGAIAISGPLSGAGNITLGTGGLALSQDTSSSYAGVISGSSTDNVTFAGSGVLTLSNTSIYSGSTTINSGVLNVAGGLSNTSGVTVAAVGTLAGSGAVNAAVADNGVVFPSDNFTPTTLTVNTITFAGAGAYSVKIDGTTGANDLLSATNATLTGGALNVYVTPGANLQVGDTFTILNSTNAIAGQFTNGATVTATNNPGYLFSVAYSANTVTLTLTQILTSPEIDVINGNEVVYLSLPGINSALTVSTAGNTYTVTDTGTPTITLSPAAVSAGWTVNNNIATGPTTNITSMLLQLSDGNDSIVALNGGSAGVTITGSGALTVTGPATTTGSLTISQFATVTDNAAVSAATGIAISSATALTLNGSGSFTSSAGNIAVNANLVGSGLTFNSSSTVTFTAGDGAMTLGSETVSQGALLIQNASTVTLNGTLTDNNSPITISNVADVVAGPGENLVTPNLNLSSTHSLGTSANNLISSASVVVANSGTGGVYLTQNGSASFTASATLAGNVSIIDPNAADTVTLGGTISTVSGNIIIAAAGAINDAANINAGSGAITISADTAGTGAAGAADFTEAANGVTITTTNASAGAITINVNTASGGTANANIRAIAVTAGTLTINSHGGSILYAGADALGVQQSATYTLFPGITGPAPSGTGAGGANSAPTGSVNALHYVFSASGAGSIGTETRPINTHTSASNTELLAAGSGGIYFVDFGNPMTLNGATATGAGSVEVVAANANGHNLTVAGNVTTGSGTIVLAADDNFIVNSGVTIGGAGFSGDVYLAGNRDTGNTETVTVNGNVVTSSTSPSAVVIEGFHASGNGTAAGRVIVNNVTVGDGGTITVSAVPYNLATGQGSITALNNLSVLNAGPNGTVDFIATMMAGNTLTSAVGAAGAPMIVTAGTVIVTADSGISGLPDSIYVTDTVAGGFTATTGADSPSGSLNLTTTDGVLTVAGPTNTGGASAVNLTGAAGVTVNAPLGTDASGAITINAGTNNVLFSTSSQTFFSTEPVTIFSGTPVEIGANVAVTLNNDTWTAASGTQVDSGGTLAGTGTVASVVTALGTAAVNPGTPVGTLNVDSVILSAASSVSVTLDSTAAGQYSQIAYAGTADLAGANLTVNVGGGVNLNDVFTIVSTSGGTLSGIFGNAATTITASNNPFYVFSVSYAGNSVTLTVTQVPTADIVDVVGAAVNFYALANTTNNLTVALTGGNYSIADSAEVIDLSPAAIAAGWIGNGTNTVTGPASYVNSGDTINIASLAFSTEDGADTIHSMSVGSANLSITGDGTGTLDFEGNVTTTGNLAISGYTTITDGAAGTTGVLTANTLTLPTVTGVGTASNPILTSALNDTATATAGAIYITQSGAGNITATASGAVTLTSTSGTLTVAITSTSGGVTLSTADSLVLGGNVNAGDGQILINADTDGLAAAGAASYNQAGFHLTTTNTGDSKFGFGPDAVIITVNTASGGLGDAIIGMGSIGAGGIGEITVNANGGNILWSNDPIYTAFTAAQTGLANGGSNSQTLDAADYVLLTTGTGSIGTSARPIQTAAHASAKGLNDSDVSLAAGSGGIYLVDWASVNDALTVDSAIATGAGNIRLVAANAGAHNMYIDGPVTTGSGSITLYADDDLYLTTSLLTSIPASIGGAGFSGTVDLKANRDLGNYQVLVMQSGTSIVTSNTSANAVSLLDNSGGTSTDSPGDPLIPDGGVVVTSITTGNGGGITIAANDAGGSGGSTTPGGSIAMRAGGILDTGANGTVTLIANSNAALANEGNIGSSGSPINVNAGSVIATSVSAGSAAAPTSNIFLNSVNGSTFTVSTTGNGASTVALTGQVNAVLTTTTAAYNSVTTAGTALDLSGTTLSIAVGAGFAPTPDGVFDILVNSTGQPIAAPFSNFAEGQIFSPAGSTDQFQITYLGGASGHDVVLTYLGPVVTTQPVNQTVAPGTTATFTAAAIGATQAPTVQWYVNTNNGSGFTLIPSATSTTLTVTNTSLAMTGYQYEAIFTNTYGTATTTAATLTVGTVPTAPTVTSVTPSTGPDAGGTSVTIVGTGFTGATQVQFGNTNATSFIVNSDTSITAVDPAGTGVVDITVVTANGTSATSSVDQFTYVSATSVSLVNNGPNPSTLGTNVSFTVTITGGTPINGETVTIEDADNANAVVASPTLVGSTVTFDISNLTVGTHHLFAVYGGDATHAGSNNSATPVAQTVNPSGAAPSVLSVVVNGGAPQYTDGNGVQVSLAGQNSIVEQLLVTFNEAVTLDAGAFTISTNLANFQSLGGIELPNTDPVGLNAPIPVVGSGGTQFILTFLAGSGVNSIPGGVGTYIKDGVYNLNTIGSHVHANSQTAVDNHAGFWALFGSVAADNLISGSIGDGNSDILVDTPDAAQFKIAFGTENDSSLLPDQAYDAAMDSNLSGVIGTEDAAKFKHNFGTEWMF